MGLQGHEEERTHLKGWTKRLQTLDPTTGLLNRNGWMEYAARILHRAGYTHENLGVLLIELDQFASITEECGYRVGEETLQVVADALEQQVRPGDILGRWLEDQFILLLAAAKEEVLGIVGERLRKAVEATNYLVEGRCFPLSLSIGGASAIAKTGTVKELNKIISKADGRMSVAKRQGRNQVVF
jgi:diguanylate cyclase (GGDEF)-like protein